MLSQRRLRRGIFDSEEEMKDTLQEEWEKITQEEIKHRIADMNRNMRRTRTIKWRFSSRYRSGNTVTDLAYCTVTLDLIMRSIHFDRLRC